MNSSIKYKDEQKEKPLITKPELFQAALDEFSKKSFHEASLNDMLKAVQMNKGSFYHRFYDKTDLYLCMIEMIAFDKIEYMQNKISTSHISIDFFEQLKIFAIAGLEYAQHEKRYYRFWRNYLAESTEFKNTVKKSFPDFANDVFDKMVSTAVSSGKLSSRYDKEFISKTISIYFYNLDSFLTDSTEEKEIITIVEQLISFLKHGFLDNE